jgi:hypothetical protein
VNKNGFIERGFWHDGVLITGLVIIDKGLVCFWSNGCASWHHHG